MRSIPHGQIYVILCCMPKIALLSDFVADQIAAGEVVEHPAAAVKELLENAIDAGASEISIEIEGGGLQRIAIEDDGCGMGREDATLCLKRHATSKIRSTEDLQNLLTMGFRGEALAALASVSMLELKTFDGAQATHISAQGGVIAKAQECARNRGTTIEARSLFFNAPARLKFQKSASACAAAVLKTVQTIALAHPEIRFFLRSNGKLTFQADQKPWKERAQEVLGSFAHEVEWAVSPLSIRGLIGRPEEGKANRSGQMLFVNRRPIFSPLIAKAVKEGFGTRLQESLYPTFLLFLELPADSIDVNVHPQKKEIRFREEGRVYAFVREAVSRAFGAAPEISPMPWEFQPPIYPALSSFSAEYTPSTFVFQEAPLPIQMEKTPKALLGDYLLVEGDGWLFIDLKGAKARILFEELKKPHPVVQPLIWPLEIEVAPNESVEEMVNLLQEARIEARTTGKRTLSVDALPEGIEPGNISEFVRQLAAEKGSRRLAAALTKACRVSSRFSFEEAVLIWRRLSSCGDREYDPLGKKIAARITEDQIAEFFH